MGTLKDNRTVATLVGGIVALGLLWVTFAPGTVTRAEMQTYVDVTATEHLRLLRQDFKETQKVLVEVRERLAGVESILRERDR